MKNGWNELKKKKAYIMLLQLKALFLIKKQTRNIGCLFLLLHMIKIDKFLLLFFKTQEIKNVGTKIKR